MVKKNPDNAEIKIPIRARPSPRSPRLRASRLAIKEVTSPTGQNSTAVITPTIANSFSGATVWLWLCPSLQ
jgi:hypothetical protein